MESNGMSEKKGIEISVVSDVHAYVVIGDLNA